MGLEQLSPKFATALVDMQGEIEGAVKGNNNPAFRSKYADLGACWDACRESLQKHGIGVFQFPTQAEPGYVGLRTVLVYKPTGEIFTGFYKVPLKDPTNPQALGSAITYARRYALCSIVGICPVDDDGNAASKAVPESKKAGTTAKGATSGESVAAYTASFGLAKTYDEKKEVYRQLKNSAVPEPTKTALLTEWATVIKGMKG